jgi:hypothetical protein
MHGAIMPDLNKLRNRFIRGLSLFLHDRPRSKRQQLRDETVSLQSSYLNLTSSGVRSDDNSAAICLRSFRRAPEGLSKHVMEDAAGDVK